MDVDSIVIYTIYDHVHPVILVCEGWYFSHVNRALA